MTGQAAVLTARKAVTGEWQPHMHMCSRFRLFAFLTCVCSVLIPVCVVAVPAVVAVSARRTQRSTDCTSDGCNGSCVDTPLVVCLCVVACFCSVASGRLLEVWQRCVQCCRSLLSGTVADLPLCFCAFCSVTANFNRLSSARSPRPALAWMSTSCAQI